MCVLLLWLRAVGGGRAQALECVYLTADVRLSDCWQGVSSACNTQEALARAVAGHHRHGQVGCMAGIA